MMQFRRQVSTGQAVLPLLLLALPGPVASAATPEVTAYLLVFPNIYLTYKTIPRNSKIFETGLCSMKMLCKSYL